MEPELPDGDRLLVDTLKQKPAAGGMSAPWDGSGPVVKRIGFDRDDRGKPLLRLESANPEYADYTVRRPPGGRTHRRQGAVDTSQGVKAPNWRVPRSIWISAPGKAL